MTAKIASLKDLVFSNKSPFKFTDFIEHLSSMDNAAFLQLAVAGQNFSRSDGFSFVGRGGKKVNPTDLLQVLFYTIETSVFHFLVYLQAWIQGKPLTDEFMALMDPAVLVLVELDASSKRKTLPLWSLGKKMRQREMNEWSRVMMQEQQERLAMTLFQIQNVSVKLNEVHSASKSVVLRRARFIGIDNCHSSTRVSSNVICFCSGCTTTGAAKNKDLLDDSGTSVFNS